MIATWALIELYDDGDPGDRAHVRKIRVFESLDGLRIVLSALIDSDKLRPDVSPEDLELDGMTEEDCRKHPEIYDWLDTSGDPDEGWDGGTIYTVEALDEVEP